MNVDEKKAADTAVVQGKTYYLCSPGCKAAFGGSRRSTPEREEDDQRHGPKRPQEAWLRR
jgi:YHS domain-containing protein